MKHQTDYLAIDGITNIRKTIDMPISKNVEVIIALIYGRDLAERDYRDLQKSKAPDYTIKCAYERYQTMKELIDTFMNDKNLLGGHQ